MSAHYKSADISLFLRKSHSGSYLFKYRNLSALVKRWHFPRIACIHSWTKTRINARFSALFSRVEDFMKYIIAGILRRNKKYSIVSALWIRWQLNGITAPRDPPTAGWLSARYKSFENRMKFKIMGYPYDLKKYLTLIALPKINYCQSLHLLITQKTAQ